MIHIPDGGELSPPVRVQRALIVDIDGEVSSCSPAEAAAETERGRVLVVSWPNGIVQNLITKEDREEFGTAGPVLGAKELRMAAALQGSKPSIARRITNWFLGGTEPFFPE